MNKRIFGFMALLAGFVVLCADGADKTPPDTAARLVCVGRVEAVDGEIDVSAQMPGTLKAVLVKEGDWVTKGTVLAEVDAPREKAALDLALAQLARVKAGNGAEEIAAAVANSDAIATELTEAQAEYERAEKLRADQFMSIEDIEIRHQRAETLSKQLVSAQKQVEALKRGPLPEDIALAEAQVAAAQAAYDLHLVRAESDGSILHLNLHTGDFVALSFPSPILHMANTRQLWVRIEINELDVVSFKPGMEGEFTTYGAEKTTGRLVLKTILPAFAPRRLFEPDSTARMDTRTLEALCDITSQTNPVYAGQRVTVTFPGK